MDTGIKVGDCMKTPLITISENASVYDAAKKMADHGIGSLLVEKNKSVKAIVTDYDLVEKALAKKKTDMKIGQLASKPLVTISPEKDLSEAARKMGDSKIRHLVVMQGGKAVGMISSTDIIRISPSLYDLIAQKQALEDRARKN